jgi:hypothetical protein
LQALIRLWIEALQNGDDHASERQCSGHAGPEFRCVESCAPHDLQAIQQHRLLKKKTAF